MTDPTSPNVSISLTPDEALVLFAWLSREAEREALNSVMQDASEWVAVQAVLGGLEGTFVAGFGPDYQALLEDARARLRKRFPADREPRPGPNLPA